MFPSKLQWTLSLPTRGTLGTPGTIFTCSSMIDDHESIWGLWNKTMNHLRIWLVQSFQSSHQSVEEILKTFWISKIQFLPGHVLPSHLLPHAVALALGEGQHAFFCGWTTLPGFGAPDPTTTVSSLKVSPASKEVPWFKFQAKVFRWHSWGHMSSHTAETLLGKQHAPKVHPWPT